MSVPMQDLIDAANDSIADFQWDHGDIIPQDVFTLISSVKQLITHPDVAKWMASGELTMNTTQQCTACGKCCTWQITSRVL